MSSLCLYPRYTLCALTLFVTPVLAQRVRIAEPLPKDPDALVAKTAGEDLPTADGWHVVDSTPGSRAAAALVAMKDDAVPALTRGLESDDYTIRLNAVYILGSIGTPATLPPRIKAAADAHPKVREQAVAKLPAYQGDEARQTLLKALKDPDPSVRNAAVRAFQPGGKEKLPGNAIRFATANVLIPLLDDPATQYATAEVLGHLGMNVAARPLLKLLKAEDKSVRFAAVVALGRFKDNQVSLELTVALRDEDSYVRRYAAQSLGQIGDLRTTTALVEQLSDKEFLVRYDAAGALGQIGDPRAVPGLLSLLADPNEQIRAAAADALGKIGDLRALEPLCKLLVRNGRENASVARALGRLRDPRAIEPLARFLLDPDSLAECSDEAADALAQFRHGDAVAALVKVSLTTRDDVQLNARRALRTLTGFDFSFVPNETIATWWEQNREHYLLAIPEKK